VWGISLLQGGPGRAVALGVVAVAVLLHAPDIGSDPESRLRVSTLKSGCGLALQPTRRGTSQLYHYIKELRCCKMCMRNVLLLRHL
jgi:hypothetical protein